MIADTTHDVVVLGGGLSGLCLCHHLARARPGLRLALVDPLPLPRPAGRPRLGESLTEISSDYLARRIGLRSTLENAHQRKLGLRFFLPGGALGERAELGILGEGAPPGDCAAAIPATWQVHRGRLEHDLVSSLPATVVEGRPEVDVGPPHRVRAGGQELVAPVVVDATGGPGVLDFGEGPRRFDHGGQAAWFWVQAPLDVGAWSDVPAFRRAAHPDVRWRATTHLVGPRGWVWLIRLADGSTSVGIVRPPQAPFADDAELDAWLAADEPELAAALRGVPRSALAQRGWTAHLHETVLDVRGLARAGDAAGFIDPLYSSGADLMALTNETLVPRLLQAVDGRLRPQAVRRANRQLGLVRGQCTRLYADLFEVMRSPRAMMARVVWDLAIYFGFLAPLARSGAFSGALSPRSVWVGQRVADLHARVTAALLAWARQDTRPSPGRLDQARCTLLNGLLSGLDARPEGRSLDALLAANLATLEVLAVALFRRAGVGLGLALPPGPLNPYALGLDPLRWTADGLESGVHRRAVPPSVRADLAALWA